MASEKKNNKNRIRIGKHQGVKIGSSMREKTKIGLDFFALNLQWQNLRGSRKYTCIPYMILCMSQWKIALKY